MKKIACILFTFSVILTSCQNGEWEFPDFDYQTVYFAYQFPVRTITLGDDIVDTSLDNLGKFKIMATTGGVYESPSSVTIDIEVDNSLVEDLAYSDNGEPILAMPSNYYSLASNKITIPAGKLIGGVEVQLTDAFFADPLSIERTYVIPVRMINVHNADSILFGLPISDGAKRGVTEDWSVLPKDFTFYAVKYINPWHGYYLRRGVEVISGDVDTTITRHKQFVEDDEVTMVHTFSLNQIAYPLVFKDSGGNNVNCTLLLSFNEDGNCSVSSGTLGYSATGSGKFVSKGEKKSWGNQDRDALYLNYSIDLGGMQIQTTDTLVARNRGVVTEVFNPQVD